MAFRAARPDLLEALLAQLLVPERWEVLADASLAGGWLGVMDATLAVLAPGPGGNSLHRAQLVAFLVSADAAGARADALGRVRLAAAAGIPEAWLVDAACEWTEIFRAPFDGRYRSRQLCYPGEAVHPLALPRLPVVPLAAG